MVSIRTRKKSNGLNSFAVDIRTKKTKTTKTFQSLEDAKLYSFYRERLDNLKKNFDVSIEKRITLINLMDLKAKTIDESNKRSINEIKVTLESLKPYIDEKKYVHEITLEDWKHIKDQLLNTDVFMGAKTESAKRKMSHNTLRRRFACLSSCFSHAQSLGIELDNHPLKIMQIYNMNRSKKSTDD
jgi:hypothetical protein